MLELSLCKDSWHECNSQAVIPGLFLCHFSDHCAMYGNTGCKISSTGYKISKIFSYESMNSKILEVSFELSKNCLTISKAAAAGKAPRLGLAWILQNRTWQQQLWHAADLAATVANSTTLIAIVPWAHALERFMSCFVIISSAELAGATLHFSS
jgi:hypothetical protein